MKSEDDSVLRPSGVAASPPEDAGARPSTMRLSEAIRLGATMKPQAFCYFFKDGATCAQGSALDAVGRLSGDAVTCHDAVAQLWPWASPLTLHAERFSCPACGLNYGVLRMATLIAHLNNDHEWTRERIADFVELHEGIPDVERPEVYASPDATPVGGKSKTTFMEMNGNYIHDSPRGLNAPRSKNWRA